MATQVLELMVGQIWQVTILCVVARWLSKTVLKNQPMLSYQLWMLVMLKSVTPPLWASHCGVFSWLFQSITTATASVVQSAFGATVSSQRVALLLIFAWGVGAVLSMLSVCLKWRHIKRRITRGSLAKPAAIEASVANLALRLDITRPIRLVITSEPIGPAIVGFWNPLLVLPTDVASEKSIAEIEPILAHELVHVRRGDTLVALLETVVRCVWWFHPSVQRAADSMSQVGELCCDQDVLERLAYEPRRYANSLIQVIEARCKLQPLACHPGIRQEQLTRERLKRIMKRTYARPRLSLRLGLLLLGLLIVLPGRSFG